MVDLGLDLDQKALRSYTKKLLRKLDKDESGDVDFKEFLSFYKDCLADSVQRQKYIVDVKKRSLTKREKSAAKAAWAKYDADHNGTIGRSELVAMITEQLDMQLTKLEVDVLVDELLQNSSKDVSVNFEQFQKFFRHCLVNEEKKAGYKKQLYLTGQEVQAAGEVFKKYDVDNSGTIDVKELSAILRDLGISLSNAQFSELASHVRNPEAKTGDNDDSMDILSFTRFFRACLSTAEKQASYKEAIIRRYQISSPRNSYLSGL